jgi:hypothetical protein
MSSASMEAPEPMKAPNCSFLQRCFPATIDEAAASLARRRSTQSGIASGLRRRRATVTGVGTKVEATWRPIFLSETPLARRALR